MIRVTLGTADFPIRSGHEVVADMEAALAEIAKPGPAPRMIDVYCHPGDFDLLVRGKAASELQTAGGRKFWDWHGGGVRYWRGQLEMPLGR